MQTTCRNPLKYDGQVLTRMRWFFTWVHFKEYYNSVVEDYFGITSQRT